LCRAVVLTPAEPPEPGWLGSSDLAFPFPAEGRLPRLTFSGPARRSLTLRPGHSLSGPCRPWTSKALDRSLPPDRLRLLPGGQPPSRMGLAPIGSTPPFHGARRKRKRRQTRSLNEMGRRLPPFEGRVRAPTRRRPAATATGHDGGLPRASQRINASPGRRPARPPSLRPRRAAGIAPIRNPHAAAARTQRIPR
jgi:hypothetical protein